MKKTCKFSIISTCKGRLQYLKESLPSYVQQHEAEVIIVDFDCPQGTADYITSNFETVKLVKIKNRPKFNPSEARNEGAKIASGDFFVFVDCDIVVTNDFCEKLTNFSEYEFGIFEKPNDLKGTCVIPSEAFKAIQGYDEVMVSYAGEDLDIYNRLKLARFQVRHLDSSIIRKIILNTAVEKIQFGDVGRRLGFARGTIYRELKLILLRLERRNELSKPLRDDLWNNIDKLVKKNDIFEHEHFIDVPLGKIYGGGILKDSSFEPSVRMSIKLAK